MASENPERIWTPDSLPRGQACVYCRRRRLKCDGQRPVCGSCIRSGKREECEYAEGQSPTTTQLLEEDISRLEARINELESPESDSSVKLFYPYQEPGQASAVPYATMAPSSPSGHLSDSSRASSLLNNNTIWEGTVASSGTSIAVPEVDDFSWDQTDFPLLMETAIVDNFFLHAFEFGFFLNQDRFRNSILFASIPEQRPIPALLSSVHLLGVHVSERNDLTVHEPTLLSHALRQISTALSDNHPKQVLHIMQAEVLLAHYFFRSSRFLEGQYHINAAVSLCIGSGLHKLRTKQTNVPVMQFIGGIQSSMPSPQDAVEEGEMINGFWTVFILDKCWCACLGTPSLITDNDALGTQIDTPWPLDMEGYEQGVFSSDIRGDQTLQKFLANSPERIDDGMSSLAILVRASLLFGQATRLNQQWTSGELQQVSDVLQQAFVSLQNCLRHLMRRLPPLRELGNSLPGSASNFVIAHTLAHATTIRLHSIFANQNVTSKAICVEAAKAMIDITPYIDRGQTVYLNPILGMLWMVTCELLVNNIRLGRATAKEEVQQLDRLVAAMTFFARKSVLTRHQLSKVQDVFKSI